MRAKFTRFATYALLLAWAASEACGVLGIEAPALDRAASLGWLAIAFAGMRREA